MESHQKFLLCILTLFLAAFLYEDYIKDKYKNNTMIRIKLDHAQRLLDDVRNASADLNIVGPIGDLKLGEDLTQPDEDTAKAIILEAICLKDDLIQECVFEAQQCINDVIRELR